MFTNSTGPELKNQQKSRIPEQLTGLHCWGIWKLIEGKKVPFQLSGWPARTNDSTTWTEFKAVQDLSSKLFFFPEDRSFTGIDIDNCIDETGNYNQLSLDVLELFRGIAYAEVSPSGKGIKLITSGTKPEGFPCKVGNLECYDSRRAFTITEQVLEGFETIGSGQKAIDSFCERYLIRKESVSSPSVSSSCSDLISRAEAYSAKFQGLEAGSGRNQALFSLSGNLAAIENQNGERLSESDILQIVMFANRKNNPPLPDSEVKQLVSSSFRNGSKREPKRPTEKPSVEIPFLDLETGKPDPAGNPDPDEDSDSGSSLLAAEPFPIHLIPEPFRSLCKQISEATVSDVSFSAIPCLVLLAGIIGNSKVLRVKSSWKVPAIVWGSVVAESGTGKSSPAKIIFDCLQNWQLEQIKDWKQKREEYLQEMENYQKQLSKWKKADEGEQPIPPAKPICKRLLFKDSTIEKLGEELERNPKGLIISFDELTNWFNSFNRYSKTDDSAKWLEFFNGSSCTIDRKNQDLPLVIDKGSVSVFGTIQPQVLRKILSEEYRTSGLAARLLYCSPTRTLKRWNDSEPAAETLEAVQRVFNELIQAEPEVNEWGKVIPEEIPLTKGALDLYKAFYNRHNREAFQKSGDLLRSFAKLEEYALRFALVFETVKAAADRREVKAVQIDSVSEGIELVEYFKTEAERIFSLFIGSDEDYKKKEAFEYLRRIKKATAREFFRNNQSCFENLSVAEKFLQTLVEKGLGIWEPVEPSKAGGRPTRTFQLNL